MNRFHLTALTAILAAAISLAQPVDTRLAFVNRYCATCHSQSLKTGGVVLQGLDAAGMRRLLVTGGSGYLGRRMTLHAAAQGWQVILRTRSNRIVRFPVLVAEPRTIRVAITRALATA